MNSSRIYSTSMISIPRPTMRLDAKQRNTMPVVSCARKASGQVQYSASDIPSIQFPSPATCKEDSKSSNTRMGPGIEPSKSPREKRATSPFMPNLMSSSLLCTSRIVFGRWVLSRSSMRSSKRCSFFGSLCPASAPASDNSPVPINISGLVDDTKAALTDFLLDAVTSSQHHTRQQGFSSRRRNRSKGHARNRSYRSLYCWS